jgi:Holliday junction resolvase RusA-like endonuclease
MQLVVTIPMVPPAALTPNRAYRRGGWQPRRAAAAMLRHATWACAVNLRPEEPMVGQMMVSAVIRWPKGRRRLDYDAAVAVLKPVLDGLTDAGWWRDDRQVAGIVVQQETGHARGELLVSVDRNRAVLSNDSVAVIGTVDTREDGGMPGKKTTKGGKSGGEKCPNCGMAKSKCKC